MLRNFFMILLVCIYCSSLRPEVKENVFIVSVPKCGTHLLMKCVELLTGMSPSWLDLNLENQSILREYPVFTFHLRYSDELAAVLKREKFKILLMIRDPRDQIVSNAHWIQKNRSFYPELGKMPFDDLIAHLITTIHEYFGPYRSGWDKLPTCTTIKFEKLVGAQGGGNDSEQLAEINKVAKHIGLTLTGDALKHCRKNLFGGTATFKSGRIGTWKKYFSDQNRKLFKETAGKLLIDLGYETGLNW